MSSGDMIFLIFLLLLLAALAIAATYFWISCYLEKVEIKKSKHVLFIYDNWEIVPDESNLITYFFYKKKITRISYPRSVYAYRQYGDTIQIKGEQGWKYSEKFTMMFNKYLEGGSTFQHFQPESNKISDPLPQRSSYGGSGGTSNSYGLWPE